MCGLQATRQHDFKTEGNANGILLNAMTYLTVILIVVLILGSLVVPLFVRGWNKKNSSHVDLPGLATLPANTSGSRRTMFSYLLDTHQMKNLGTFGPFDPTEQTDGRYVAWTSGEEATGPHMTAYDAKTGQMIDLGVAAAQGSYASLNAGHLAWDRFFSGRGRQVVMVKDLATGLTTQLTNSPFVDQPPATSGGYVVWPQENSESDSSQGRGIFVATPPQTSPAPAFVDLAPGQLYRTAIEWLGEQGYATGFAGTSGATFEAQAPLLRSQFCVLLVRALGITVRDVPVHFRDLDTTKPGNPYEAQVMATLLQDGILQGTDQHLVAPRTPITRAQMVTLLVRALDYAHPGLLPPLPGKAVQPRFFDPAHGQNVTRAGWDSLLDGLAGFSRFGWDIWTPASRGCGAFCFSGWSSCQGRRTAVSGPMLTK